MKIRRPRNADLLAIAIAGVLAVFLISLMQSLFTGIRKERYEETWSSVLWIVNNRCDEEEYFVSDERSDYQKRVERVVLFFGHLDRNPYIFSAVYDKGLNILTERQPRFPLYPFHPFDYTDINAVMKSEDRGTITVPYSTDVHNYQMRFYFRKVNLTKSEFIYISIAIPYIASDIEVASNLTYLVLFISLAAAIAGITIYLILFVNSLRPRYVRLLKPGEKV